MVTLDDFYIDQYEVTAARFAAFLNERARDSEVVDMSITLSHYIGDESFHLLQRDGASQLVYKHAVSTIQPSRALNLAEETSDSEGD